MSLSQFRRRGRAYQCRRCSKIDRKGRMFSHVFKAHIPLARAPYHCTFCLFRCKDRQSLQNHITKYAGHRERESVMGVPDYTEVLVKAADPYFVGDDDMIQLSQEESARWFARKGRCVPDLQSDESEGLYDEEEDVVMSDGKALPRWLVEDDNLDFAGVPRNSVSSMGYKGHSDVRAATLPTFSQTFVTPPITRVQLPVASNFAVPNVHMCPGTMALGVSTAARTTYSSIGSIASSSSLAFPSLKTNVNSGGLVPVSVDPSLGTVINISEYQPSQVQNVPAVQHFQMPTSPIEFYSAQRVEATTCQTTGITSTLSYPTIGSCSMPVLQGNDVDRVLNTPKLPTRTPLDTPLQDEVQLEVTDLRDPLYLEAYGYTGNQPPPKKQRLEGENPLVNTVASAVREGQPGNSASINTGRSIPQPVPQAGGVQNEQKDQDPLRIETEEKKMTTAEAVIEAAKMICKALDDNTRVARCSEKATQKIADELARIERKITKMERTLSSKEGEETAAAECRERANKENVKPAQTDANPERKEVSKCATKKEPLKSVVHQLKKKK